jgi:hypothetical protein
VPLSRMGTHPHHQSWLSRDEQTELLRQLVQSPAHGGNGMRNAQGQAPTTYGVFLGTHPLTFAEAGEPLEAWLRTIKSKFGLLHCTEHQKTLFNVQQLLGNTGMWWANYTATHPMKYQVSWAEFCEVFRAHHISAGIMKRKHQEFMNLKQGGRYMHDYSKHFNHLAQYALEQVDTDEKKKKYHFMNGLSTKLQQCLALSTSRTFPEFVSNIIIADDVILTHKESKKRNTMQPHLVVLLQSTRWCMLPATPTCHISTNISTNKQH